MITQWGVLDDLNNSYGVFESRELAQANLDYLVSEYKPKIMAEALQEEAQNFPKGNEAYYHWNIASKPWGPKDGGLKMRRFRVVFRKMGPWTDS